MSTPAPVSYRHGGLVCTDHTLDVPLDHHTPDGPTIGLFAREVVAAGREHENLPRLLWLQGGPGGRAERPNAAGAWCAAPSPTTASSCWTSAALAAPPPRTPTTGCVPTPPCWAG